MEKKPSWDDIPSLQLELDQDPVDATSSEKRAYPRLSTQEVQEMFREKVGVLFVHVAVKKRQLKQKGVLRDINHTGMSFIMPAHPMKKGEIIRIGTVFNQFVFKTKAEVRWRTNDQVGVKFIDPKKDDVTYLSELYAAKILNKIK